MARYNSTRREKLIQEAFKRAGIAKKDCFVLMRESHTEVLLLTSLGGVRMPALRELLYRVTILTPRGKAAFIRERGQRHLERIIVLADG